MHCVMDNRNRQSAFQSVRRNFNALLPRVLVTEIIFTLLLLLDFCCFSFILSSQGKQSDNTFPPREGNSRFRVKKKVDIFNQVYCEPKV